MKRGQLEISFGIIFSIFLIIAFIGVGIYAITYFLNLSECAEIGLFYQDLDERVNKAWTSELTREVFSGSVSSDIESVCFGSLEGNPGKYDEEHQAISRIFRFSEDNVFLFPPEKGCGQDSASFNLKNAQAEEFFCVPVVDKKVDVRLTKESFDALVNLEKP